MLLQVSFAIKKLLQVTGHTQGSPTSQCRVGVEFRDICPSYHSSTHDSSQALFPVLLQPFLIKIWSHLPTHQVKTTPFSTGSGGGGLRDSVRTTGRKGGQVSLTSEVRTAGGAVVERPSPLTPVGPGLRKTVGTDPGLKLALA